MCFRLVGVFNLSSKFIYNFTTFDFASATIQIRLQESILGPVIQSVVSLTCSLVVKLLTVLVSTIPNSQVFCLKNVSSFCKCKSYSHFFSKNISINAIFNDQSFNDTLTNDIVSFEQLGPGVHSDWSYLLSRLMLYSNLWKCTIWMCDQRTFKIKLHILIFTVLSTSFRKSFFARRFKQKK